jgi:hypothetical protein
MRRDDAMCGIVVTGASVRLLLGFRRALFSSFGG